MDEKDYSQGEQQEVEFPRRLIVKFMPDIIPYKDGAETNLPVEFQEDWKHQQKDRRPLKLKCLYRSTTPAVMEEMVNQAKKMDPDYEPVNFATFFTVEVASPREAEELLGVLSRWKIVEYAYLEALPAPSPSLPSSANPDYMADAQGYLNPTNYSRPTAIHTGGIDALSAWPLVHGSGEGISYIDIEQSWNLAHREWTDATGNPCITPASLLHGQNYSMPGDDPDHGTKVVGVISMQDNVYGGVGIARDATLKLVSVWRDYLPGETHGSLPYFHDLPDALMFAISQLQAGNVLLIERQTKAANGSNAYHPVEMDPAVFAKIRLATALGITVIEPAGNKPNSALQPVDLEQESDSLGRRILDRNNGSGQFSDSGAIVVAAAFASAMSVPGYVITAQNRAYWHTNSNYGSRVDCFAWGEGVYTAENSNTVLATLSFEGTSSASAIVAGAAILVQALATHYLGGPLLPFQLRQMLYATGTNPAADNPLPIGRMPNLRNIVDKILINSIADVVIRDLPSDTGRIHTGSYSNSPDIVIRPAAQQRTAATAFDLSAINVTHVNQEIFIRVFNRGGVPANGVKATVYLVKWANRFQPGQWIRLNDPGLMAATDVLASNPPAVPAPAGMTVLPKVDWSPDPLLQPAGEYCLLVSIGCPEDPDPLPGFSSLLILSPTEFDALIRLHNNIACKYFRIS